MARPSEFEQRRRIHEFWRILSATGSIQVAQAGSKLEPRRLILLLDEPGALLVAMSLAQPAEEAA